VDVASALEVFLGESGSTTSQQSIATRTASGGAMMAIFSAGVHTHTADVAVVRVPVTLRVGRLVPTPGRLGQCARRRAMRRHSVSSGLASGRVQSAAVFATSRAATRASIVMVAQHLGGPSAAVFATSRAAIRASIKSNQRTRAPQSRWRACHVVAGCRLSRRRCGGA